MNIKNKNHKMSRIRFVAGVIALPISMGVACGIAKKSDETANKDASALDGVWYSDSITVSGKTTELSGVNYLIFKISNKKLEILDVGSSRGLCQGKQQPIERIGDTITASAVDGCEEAKADISAISSSQIILKDGKLSKDLAFERLILKRTTAEYFQTKKDANSKNTALNQKVASSSSFSPSDLEGFWRFSGVSYNGQIYKFGQVTDDGKKSISEDIIQYLHFKDATVLIINKNSTVDFSAYMPYRIVENKIISDNFRTGTSTVISGFSLEMKDFAKSKSQMTLTYSYEDQWYIKKTQNDAEDELRNNAAFQKFFTPKPIATKEQLNGYWKLSGIIENGKIYSFGEVRPSGNIAQKMTYIIEFDGDKVKTYDELKKYSDTTFDIKADYLVTAKSGFLNGYEKSKISSFITNSSFRIEDLLLNRPVGTENWFTRVFYEEVKILLKDNIQFKQIHGITD